MNINGFSSASINCQKAAPFNEKIKSKILSFAHFFKVKCFSSKQKVKIAILSDGGGFTVPKAIKMIEKTFCCKTKQVNYHSPDYQTDVSLTLEAGKAIEYIEANHLWNSKISRAEAFIEHVKTGKIHAPVSLAIIKKVQKMAKGLDCIFLPGGEDVPNAWYGKHPYFQDFNFYRSIIEITLLSEAKSRGIPVMGVCRGLQITYVFYGKKLEANITWQRGVQTFFPIQSNQTGLIGNLFKKGLKGVVNHSQGVKIEQCTSGEIDLIPLAKHDGFIKAAENRHGASSPIILTQFHPEIYNPNDPVFMGHRLSDNNSKFFEILFESAKVRNKKRLAITPQALSEARKKMRHYPLSKSR